MTLTFPAWQGSLNHDAALCGRTREISLLSTYMLQMFWESGVEPTVAALIQDCEGQSTIAVPKKPARSVVRERAQFAEST